MHDVFISFSFEDQKKAEEIVNVLTSEYGISCWICTRDIDGGKRYKRLIPDAIRAAKVVVFLQSEDAVASKEIPKEIGLAFDSDKTIIPFRIDQAPLQGDLEYDLYGIEYIDGTIPTQEQRIHELACAIAKATGKPLKNTACAPAEAEAVLASGKVVCGEIFAGRETLMQEIHEAFSDRDVVFLHGMGGIGKSQLACQYWKKYRGFYTTVVFARYETDLPSLIADDRVFNVKGASRKTRADNTPQTDEEYARDKLKLMKQYTDDHTLIILDNYDTAPEPFFEEFIRDAGYRVLVTTRHEPPRSRYHVIPVREIDDDTLKKIFMEYANPSKTMIDEDDPEFDELFALTNRHTYTLELIAKYMEEDDAIDEIGEMVELLKSAGIRNYSIWSDGRDVFGYYECEKGIAFAEKTQAGSPVVDRWNDYMEDVLELEMDPETGAQPKLRQMFMME